MLRPRDARALTRGKRGAFVTAARQSAVMCAARTTFPHFSVSLSM